ncbi:MAG: hypothetical protein J6A19_03610 [Oscillospiraceae bacterium]|nr:hypothetical protein [Oscillospiraceae bacterium]
MADTMTTPLSSAEQMQANYEKYKDKFKDANEELISSDTFLSLLVAEMTNQDPMEPTSNTEFVTQMAQFTSLTYSKNAATYSMSNYASSLVGKTVTAQKMDGTEVVTRTGVVESVLKSGDSYTVRIDGVSFDISKITSISTTADSSSGSALGENSLGSLIAKASMMIGMSATVNPQVNGGSALDSGIIQSIQVKDGQVNVIINDTAYRLDDIVEVSYPTVSEDESNEGHAIFDNEESGTDVTEVTEKMASQNLEQLMEVIDQMNENERTRLEEEAEEVTEQAAADEFLADDIQDLEDLI